MKKKIVAPMLGVSSLLVSGMAFAVTDTQTIVSTPDAFSVSPGNTVQFSVSYPSGNPEATGLGVTLYFDSSKLKFVETSNVLSTPSLHLVQSPSDDSGNADGDANTDQKIVVAFANFNSDPFVATDDMPADLFTVTFTVKDDFSSDTGINFTGSPAVGYSFASTPISIVYNDTDTVAPSITAPADQTVEATAALTPVNLRIATASDAVDGTLTATADKSGSFALGTHDITWSATDSAGNTATAMQTLVVEDTTAPSIQAPADQSVSATGEATSVQLGTPIVSDRVDANPTVIADTTGPFSVGTHTVTWTATDSESNSASAIQTVTIIDEGDGTRDTDTELVYVPLAQPCRIVDTRGFNSTFNKTSHARQSFLAWGAKVDLDPQRDSDGSNDLDACLSESGLIPSAVVANVTVASKAYKSRGSVVAYPNGGTPPSSSLVNFTSNNIANASTISLSPENDRHFDIRANLFGNEADNQQKVDVIIDAMGYYYPASAFNDSDNRPDLVYVPLDEPCRVVDTRGFASPFNDTTHANQSFLAWGSKDDLDLQRDVDGSEQLNACLPETGNQPSAFVANVTVAGKAFKSKGNVVAYPNGGTPPSSSLVNFTKNNIANASIISLSPDNAQHFDIQAKFFGQEVDNKRQAHVIMDATGYFYPKVSYTNSENKPGLVYVPLAAPCRVVDTRGIHAAFNKTDRITQSFLAWGSKVDLDQQRDIDASENLSACLPESGEKPAALMANVTVAAKAFKSRGNVVAYPNGTFPPNSSLVNFTANNIANSSIISLSPDNASHFDIQAQLFGNEAGNLQQTHVIVDAIGYFYPQ